MGWERIGSLFLIVLSIIVCIYSVRLKIGSLSNPASGFIPFIAGLLFGLLSLLQIIEWIILKRSKEKVKYHKIIEEGGGPGGRNRIIIVITLLLAYITIMPKLGYLISTFLLMIFLFRIGHQIKWWFLLAFSFLITLSTYLIFDRWLSCRFPVGVLEYWR